MNVYDFDGTIYNGQSSIEYFLFCISKEKKLLKYIPHNTIELFKLIYLDSMDRTNKYWHFLKEFTKLNREDLLYDFWKKNELKIKKWYLLNQEESDVIISLSPEFLIEPICKEYDIKYFIGSKINKFDGLIEGLPCKKEEKVRRFKLLFPNEEIENFYTDDLNLDAPMLSLAKNAYLVRGDNIRRIQ